MLFEIFIASLIIILTIFVHAGMLSYARDLSHFLEKLTTSRFRKLAVGTIMSTVILWILLAHMLEVWIWAFMLYFIGALPNLYDSVYFSLVSMTTLGYGDITLSSHWRILGALMAPNGLLLYGWSTAFLVSILEKLSNKK